MTRHCHEIPSQYISKVTLEKTINSLEVRSIGAFFDKKNENPNITFIHDRKKNVGPIRYKNTSRKIDIKGNRSKKKEKNKNSDTKNIDPGNPKKMRLFISTIRNNLGHKKFTPLTSVKSLVLNLRAMASTNRNELVERSAWLISIQKLANIRFDCPLITQIVNQCISTTVEYATNFFRSIW